MKQSKLSLSSLALSLAVVAMLSGCEAENQNPLAQKVNKDMVLVDGGSFTMGSDSKTAKESEMPAHEVKVNSFYISKYEVTQSLYNKVMGGSFSYFPGPNNPVNNISWQQVNKFIGKLNKETGEHYRLPTEAEWEYAAIGGDKSKGYTYSGSNDLDAVGWYVKNSKGKAHEVGQKEPNELGLYDMSGNVGEYTQDTYDDKFYANSPKDNPLNETNVEKDISLKAVRGGSFSYNTNESENFRRDFVSDNIVMADMGIRLVKDAKK